MDAIERRGKSLRKRDAPGERRRAAIVVADEKAPDAAYHLTHGERRGGRREHAERRPAFRANGRETGEQSADEAAEPAHAAAIEEQREERSVAEVLEHVEQLGPEQSADQAV